MLKTYTIGVRTKIGAEYQSVPMTDIEAKTILNEYQRDGTVPKIVMTTRKNQYGTEIPAWTIVFAKENVLCVYMKAVEQELVEDPSSFAEFAKSRGWTPAEQIRVMQDFIEGIGRTADL